MNESKEMYLETILKIRKRKGMVRSIDIAREMELSRASVSRAVGLLLEKEFIIREADGCITLTPKGEEKAADIYRKHLIIKEYLKMALQVDDRTAEEDACRIEHVISEETFDKMFMHVKQGE